MVSTKAVVHNARGIHLRPSGVIAAAIRSYPGLVRIEKDDGSSYEISSPLSILGLGLSQYSAITIQVSGPDEASESAHLADLFSQNYDFS